METMEHNLKTLVTEMAKKPWEFSLHQAMFVLELIKGDKNFGDGLRSNEPADLKAYCSFSAPSSDCTSFEKINERPILTINQTSLIGINGTLPQRYTENILSKTKEKNYRLLDFIDIFNHRFFGLSHKIEKKTKLNLNVNQLDNFIYLNAIAGMQKTSQWESVLSSFPNFLWQKNKTAQGLKSILQALFAFKIKIEQFIGQWIEIDQDCSAVLNKQRMQNKILGKRAYCVHRAIKIIMNINNLENYNAMLPGTRNYKLIQQICKYYLSPGFMCKLQLRLSNAHLPLCTLDKHYKLGLNTWAGSASNFTCTLIL